MGSIVLLGDTFPQDIFKIVFFECLFELLLAGAWYRNPADRPLFVPFEFEQYVDL